jgi:predicted GH43/DUF377 family glycosyl hydrolase
MFLHELIRRYEGNPIIRPEQIPNCSAVCNSGFIEHDGQTIGILRAEQLSGLQSMRLARSSDGIHFQIDPEPIIVPQTQEMVTYLEANYDPRITKIGKGVGSLIFRLSPFSVGPRARSSSRCTRADRRASRST